MALRSELEDLRQAETIWDALVLLEEDSSSPVVCGDFLVWHIRVGQYLTDVSVRVINSEHGTGDGAVTAAPSS